MPAPVGQGVEGDEGLQSGYIHPEGKLAVTYLCRTFQKRPGRTHAMPLDNGLPVVILLYVSVDKDKRLPPSLSLQF